ncbi:MAG: PxKF domain-containing protein, partial [Chloroflexota bacterium]|nr:PxKF domain-containing protein [Chloroflexota bacterium]
VVVNTNTSTDGLTVPGQAVADVAGNVSDPSDMIVVKVDQDAPTIVGSRTPDANSDGWNNSDVTVSFDCDDALSGIASCTANQVVADEGTNQSVTGTAVDNADNSSSTTVSNIDIDLTAPNAPSVSADRVPEYSDLAVDWYKDTVTVSFAGNGDPDLADGTPGSGVDPASIPAATTFSASGQHTASGSVADLAGNVSAPASLTLSVDATAPAIMLTCPTSVVLNGAAVATWTATDGESGLATASTGTIALDTSSAGAQTAIVPAGTAEDNVGHLSSAASCSYSVSYLFTGFNEPARPMNAGQAIPMTWQITDAAGDGIGDLDSVASLTFSACGGGPATAADDAGSSGLRYQGAGRWHFNWKTPKSLAGSCQILTLTLNDGTTHSATFQFK